MTNEEKATPIENMSYIAYVRPGSSKEKAFKATLPADVLNNCTIEEIVKYVRGLTDLKNSQKEIHTRVVAETNDKYGAQIGDTVYGHPDKATSGDMITDNVLEEFKEGNMIGDLGAAISAMERKKGITEEFREEHLKTLRGQLAQVKESGSSAYMKLQIIVAEKLAGGAINPAYDAKNTFAAYID